MTTAPDPIYAIIDRHRTAWAAFNACETDAELNRCGDIARAANRKLIAMKPTTREGAIALAMYYREFFKADAKDMRTQFRDDPQKWMVNSDAGLGLIPNEWPWVLLDVLAEHFGEAEQKAA